MMSPGGFVRIALALIAIVGSGREAAAHADLVRAVPPPGGRVDAPPTEVLIWYTEGLQHGVISVQDQNNHRVDAGRVVIGPDDRKAIRVPLQRLPDAPGIYTLRWEVLSDDGHTTSGSFFFIVGGVDFDRATLLGMFAPREQEGYRFHPLEPLLRGLLLISIVALLGISLTSRFAIRHPLQRADAPPGALENAERRTRRLVAVSALVLLADAAALALLRTATAFGSIDSAKVAQFSATGLGRMWIVQTLAAAAVLAPLALRRGGVHIVAPLAGAVAAWSVSTSSHSATYVEGISGIVADLGHMSGAAFWAGGLFAMTLVAGPVLAALPGVPARALGAAIVARFTLAALLGVGLAASTGLLVASWHVPGGRSLVTTLYGSTLSIKVVLVAGALALGATARLYVLRRLRDAGAAPGEDAPRSPVGLLRSIVGVEALLLVLVLLASGLITSAPTALAASHVAPARGAVAQEAPLGGGRVVLNIVPTQIGLNVFDVRVADAQGSPMPVEDVTFVLRHPQRGVELDPIEPESVEPGLWSAVTAVSMDGVWSLRVSFLSAGTFHAHRFHFPVASPELVARMREAAIPPPVARPGPFRLLLRAASVLAALVAVIALAVEAIQRARPRTKLVSESP